MRRAIIEPNRAISYSQHRMGCFISIFLLLFPTQMMAAGIAVMEQSVKELGQAFSGAPTNIEDGSMVYFNPGAMSQVRGRLLSLSGYVIVPSATFQDHSSQLSPALGGAALRGNNGGESAGPILIPNIYYVHELTRRIAVGFGFNVPFGTHNSYHADWKGRYQAIDSEIMTLNFNPSMSFKVNEQFSLGAGFNVQYLQSKLTNAIDLGTICLQALGPAPCTSQGLLPQTADGHVSLKGDSVGFGYNFGAFYAPTQDTRLGVSYRSRVVHDVQGDANFSLPSHAQALTRGGAFVDTHSRTSVTLPDNVLFGFSHRISPRWGISADALWTHWSLVRELRTDFSSAQRDDVLDLKWQDTWRYAFGVNYSSESNRWTLRSGFAYDQTPIPNAQLRSPRIPDTSRYWLTAGLTYALLKNMHIHAAYAHLFMDDPSINRQGATSDILIGQYSEQINLGGLQLDWRF
ncbi:MAG: outer membrane protein transport protein [Nitrosomonas sp.]|jgi:long-chain fatty acid transport protein|nr:outer membrane protein transport protein [Nitrosomonas sp.]MBP9870291.1 outer membrane protein transport protein [Nitrosomonas sp.]